MSMIDVPAFLKKPTRHPRPVSARGSFVKTNGEKLSDIIRRSFDLQSKNLEDIAKIMKMNRGSYAKARDIVLLSERTNLTADDARIAAKALAHMDDRCQPRVSWEMIRPIVVRLWGTRGRRSKRSEAAGQSQFFTSISFLQTACSTSAEIPIPYLGPKDRQRALRELGEAQAALALLQQRITQEDAK